MNYDTWKSTDTIGDAASMAEWCKLHRCRLYNDRCETCDEEARAEDQDDYRRELSREQEG